LLQEGNLYKTLNKEKYTNILRRFRDAVGRKQPSKWRTNSWFIPHGNAPAHRSVFIKHFLAKNNMTTLEHTPYSPDLVPVDFYLFLRLKSELKERRFCDAAEIIRNATEQRKIFHKMASRNVFNAFTVACRSL
jgi:transposase